LEQYKNIRRIVKRRLSVWRAHAETTSARSICPEKSQRWANCAIAPVQSSLATP